MPPPPSLKAAYAEIMKFDTMNIYWHDQNIFYYLFRDDAFKLPYVYNVHTGFLLANFRAPYSVNVLVSQDIDHSVKVAHISGDFLLTRRYHPYKRQFAALIALSVSKLDAVRCLESDTDMHLRTALANLHHNATRTSIDSVLQCLWLRRRAFAAQYYYPKLKSTLLKIKRFVALRLR